jgi:hypothetical protein
MDTTKKFLALSVFISLGAAGCGGKNVTGSYSGTDLEAATTTPSTTTPINGGVLPTNTGGTAQVTLQITESNSSVTGTWNEIGTSSTPIYNSGYNSAYNSGTSANASASVTATFDGNSNLSITNLILPFDGYSCIYSGTLVFTSPTLTGTLNGTQSSGVTNGVNICPVRTINLNQTSTNG